MGKLSFPDLGSEHTLVPLERSDGMSSLVTDFSEQRRRKGFMEASFGGLYLLGHTDVSGGTDLDIAEAGGVLIIRGSTGRRGRFATAWGDAAQGRRHAPQQW